MTAVTAVTAYGMSLVHSCRSVKYGRDLALSSAHASASPHSTFHTRLHRPICTAEVPHSRCERLLASFGSLDASLTKVVAPSSGESRSDSDIADPNQNVSRPKAPLPGSGSHPAGSGARIMLWRQPGDWLINTPIASIAPPPRPRLYGQCS